MHTGNDAKPAYINLNIILIFLPEIAITFTHYSYFLHLLAILFLLYSLKFCVSENEVHSTLTAYLLITTCAPKQQLSVNYVIVIT